MTTTNIPGTAAKHEIITDACRQNRGDGGAVLEALSRIGEEARTIMKNWPPGRARFHFVLTVERIPSVPETANARSGIAGAAGPRSGDEPERSQSGGSSSDTSRQPPEVVGYSLRCIMFCVNHKPKRLGAGELEDLVEITRDQPPASWRDEECEDCGRTLGEALFESTRS